ncbi:MAG: 3'-5' exonuclease [Clostridia bacterium]|nr:3'-5' exonuclease [Clostridia bacterium]
MIDTYVALDLETTGLNPKTDKIIEIGAAKVVSGEISDTYVTFVDPGRHLDPKIIELTGIRDEMLTDAKSPLTAIKELYEFMEDDILLGHGILFDYSFCKRCAVNAGIPTAKKETKAIDTLRISRTLLPDMPSRRLSDLCRYYQIRQEAHRAFEDARATHFLFQKLQELFFQENQALFQPKILNYQVKKESPATKFQKDRLRAVMEYHHLEMDIDIDQLTKNEASRRIDQIFLKYGRMR